jgi:hypothetical protein
MSRLSKKEKAAIEAKFKKNTLRNPCKIGKYQEYSDTDSKVLMVGSITSPQGINRGYYYAADCNQFWELIDEVTKNIPHDKFLDLKKKLKSNERGVNDDDVKKQIVASFEKNLGKCHLAIAGIIDECEFKSDGAALDSEINNKTIRFNKTKIEQIINSSKIEVVVINSETVRKMWRDANIQPKKTVAIVIVDSPSTARAIPKIQKIADWSKTLSSIISNI